MMTILTEMKRGIRELNDLDVTLNSTSKLKGC